MGQFSMEIICLTGSLLRGNQQACSRTSMRRATVVWLISKCREAARVDPSRITARNTRTSPQSLNWLCIFAYQHGAVQDTSKTLPDVFCFQQRNGDQR